MAASTNLTGATALGVGFLAAAKDFDAEKFSPMVRATPALAEVINLKSRADGNSATRKKLKGGRN